eukprot:TRINITY_DN29787_c0_g1_i1.p1 TRINITY_DN29787_c0_g1~~TRINITY_DN29787_c0_g1_i1.p1  ORF type:complete len:546 (-),score=105.85 TRINITY_DN29787_c0_g1_i1:22-1659(-)
MGDQRDELQVPLAGGGQAASPQEVSWAAWGAQLVGDGLLSYLFWYAVLFVDVSNYAIGLLVVAMVLWRLYRVQRAPQSSMADVPYSCGVASVNGKELFLIATVHISPRSPKDVHAVVEGTSPDLVMIELDEERLDRMRQKEVKTDSPKEEDVQGLTLKIDAEEPEVKVATQRALWNGEQAGRRICGEVVFDVHNAHGQLPLGNSASGKLALFLRGSTGGGESLGSFAMKAHHAALGGAQAVLVVNDKDEMPKRRLGTGDLAAELRVFRLTWNCGFPPVPVLLLPKEEGMRLVEASKKGLSGTAAPQADFEVIPDSYPRRTLRRRICQNCALVFSGIGILYGIIHCFDVEVGGEFWAAESAAALRGTPCVCIDIDMNGFWSRITSKAIPTPCNLLNSFISWLAMPRLFFRFLFPPPGNVDTLGCTVLHASSFSIKTWVVFMFAGFASSFVMSHVLLLLSAASEHGAEEAGVHVKDQDRDQLQQLIMLAIELYLFPQLFEAIVASRDESMYQGIVAKSNEFQAKRLVAVMGAGHSNGVLERIRARGL